MIGVVFLTFTQCLCPVHFVGDRSRLQPRVQVQSYNSSVDGIISQNGSDLAGSYSMTSPKNMHLQKSQEVCANHCIVWVMAKILT